MTRRVNAALVLAFTSCSIVVILFAAHSDPWLLLALYGVSP